MGDLCRVLHLHRFNVDSRFDTTEEDGIPSQGNAAGIQWPGSDISKIVVMTVCLPVQRLPWQARVCRLNFPFPNLLLCHTVEEPETYNVLTKNMPIQHLYLMCTDNIYVSRAQTKVHINKNKYFYRILVTYESSHYVMSSNWQPRVQRWRQCRQQLLHQLCLRQHTCRVRTSVGKTQLRTKLAQFVSVLSLELRLQPFPSLDSSFCLENLDELLNVTR